MSRMSEPLMPALATARQAMISRSWASMTKAARTTSPFQQPNSNQSEHQRRLERITMTVASGPPGVFLKQEAVLLHDSVDAFVVGRRLVSSAARSRFGTAVTRR